jgi:hypothetical protein
MHPDQARAGPSGLAWRRLGLAFALVAALTGCGVLPGPIGAEAADTQTANMPAAAPVAEPAPDAQPAPPQPAAGQSTAPDDPVETVLAYIDRIRDLPQAELAQESRRLADAGDSPVSLMQQAAVLAQLRGGANIGRAQSLLQRVLGRGDGQAHALHPLARLLTAQLAEARRADEQIERQSQQLRDAQRRIDQLSERLEAVRAIERSLPSPAAAGGPPAPAPAPARP